MNSSFTAFLTQFQAAPLTKRAYTQSLDLFDRFLHGAEPTEERVEAYMLNMQGRGLASGSVNRHLSAIRAYFLWRKKKAPPEKRGLYDLMVKGPKVHRKLPPVPSTDEVNKVLAVCETPYERALLMTLYDGALRISELECIEAENIDYDNGTVKIVGKGGDEAIVPVGDKTLEALKAYIGGRRGIVFPQKYWEHRRDLRQLARKAGVKAINPHQLRHARASELRAQGVALEDIKDFLRHKNYDTTLIYATLQPVALQKRLTKAF